MKGGIYIEEIIIAICDLSESYVFRIADELSKLLKKPYNVYSFTSTEELKLFSEEREIFLLIISESSLTAEMPYAGIRNHILLSEEGKHPEFGKMIDRYQPYKDILNEIMNYLTEQKDYVVPIESRKNKWKVIGLYTPVHRSLQTTFALSIGQLLSRNKKVLYISFENFPVISGLQIQQSGGDITDLLYFFDCDKEKLIKKLPLLIKSLNGLDYILPSQAYFDTYDRTGKKWIDFFELLENNTEYDYLILDLSECVQGLLDILGYCDRIYTIGKEDTIGIGKMQQYEQWMQRHSYANVIEKTKRFVLPMFEQVPNHVSIMTHTELLRYANAVVQEDLRK